MEDAGVEKMDAAFEPAGTAAPEATHQQHQQQREARVRQILTLPTTVSLLPFSSLARWSELSKHFRDVVSGSPESIGYWPAMCSSFASAKGLYTRYTVYSSPLTALMPTIEFGTDAAKKVFFDELWTTKAKWQHAGDPLAKALLPTEVFKIKVAARFRPEPRGDEGLHLPLHQFLAVRRSQSTSSKQSDGVLVGCADPVEFVDPFMGTLMREPVLLLTSHKICDRSVAVASILRGGRCPFSGRKLSLEMLSPQPELAQRIEAWRREKHQAKNSNLTVSLAAAQPLLEKNALDPELLAMLQEMDALAALADRAQAEAAGAVRRGALRTDGTAAAGDGNDNVSLADADPAHGPLDAQSALAALQLESQGIDENHNPNHMPLGLRPTELDLSDGRASRKAGEKPRVIDLNRQVGVVNMCEPGAGVRPYYFSQVHDGDSRQAEVYSATARPAVHAALNGFNSTVLCYGQTGSGKTYTFFGPEGALECDGVGDMPPDAGVLVRALADVMDAAACLATRGTTLSLTAQYVEIFEESCTDLVSGAAVQVRRESGELVGCEEFAVADLGRALDYLRLGQARKRFAATAMNDRSSRSHTVFLLHLAHTRDDSDALVRSHMSFVDLAGSERVKKSKVEGARLKEAIGINNSLLVLGKCIQALVAGASHVPYLESKLTTLLRGSFGGSARTHVVTCCRQADAYGDETLWSLRFGERCSMITNHSKMVAAGSLSEAVRSLDQSLAAVSAQLALLEARGFAHLDSYAKLAGSLRSMQLKRRELEGRGGK